MKMTICASLAVACLCVFAAFGVAWAHCPETTTNWSLCIGRWNLCVGQNAFGCANLQQAFTADDPRAGNWSCRDNTPNDSECIVCPLGQGPDGTGLKLCNVKGACEWLGGVGCVFNNGLQTQPVMNNFYIVLACQNPS